MMTAMLHQEIAPGIEPIFIEWAKKDGKPIAYLETPATFPTLADAIPIPVVERTVTTLIADLTIPQKSLMAMYDAWVRRDVRAFCKTVESSPLMAVPEMRKAVLDLRNESWADGLGELMNVDRNTLVAIGALHVCLPGNALECAGIDAQMIG